MKEAESVHTHTRIHALAFDGGRWAPPSQPSHSEMRTTDKITTRLNFSSNAHTGSRNQFSKLHVFVLLLLLLLLGMHFARFASCVFSCVCLCVCEYMCARWCVGVWASNAHKSSDLIFTFDKYGHNELDALHTVRLHRVDVCHDG